MARAIARARAGAKAKAKAMARAGARATARARAGAKARPKRGEARRGGGGRHDVRANCLDSKTLYYSSAPRTPPAQRCFNIWMLIFPVGFCAWRLSGPLWLSGGHIEVILACIGAILGLFGATAGLHWGVWGPSWGHPGLTWSGLEPIWASLTPEAENH